MDIFIHDQTAVGLQQQREEKKGKRQNENINNTGKRANSSRRIFTLHVKI